MIRSIVMLGVGLLFTACGGDPATPPTPTPPPEATVDETAAETLVATTGEQGPVDAAAPTTGANPDGAAAGTMPAEGPAVPVKPPEGLEGEIDLPSFARLIGDGPSVTIKVTIQGAEQGELAFQALEDDGHSRMLHVQPATGTELSLEAPATYDGDIYVSITTPEDPSAGLDATAGRAQGTPERRGAGVQVGGAEAPIRLAGGDVSVTVVAGTAPSWLEKLAQQGVREGGGERAQ